MLNTVNAIQECDGFGMVVADVLPLDAGETFLLDIINLLLEKPKTLPLQRSGFCFVKSRIRRRDGLSTAPSFICSNRAAY